MADMDNAPLDLSALSDDQRKALQLSQQSKPDAGPGLLSRASNWLADHKEGLDTGIKALEYTSPGAVPMYMANQLTGAAPAQDKAAAPKNPWDGIPSGSDRQMLSMQRDAPPPAPVPPQGNIARGMAGPPVDYMKRAADETGNSVSTAPVDVAQGNANQIADQGADIQGAIGANSAANAQGAMTADQIDRAKYDTQHADLDKHITALNNRSAAIDEDVANARIDPDRKWKNTSTGGKILSQLAVGFGALGQAFGQKTNIGLDNLHKSIDDDVDEQKREIESKKGLSANLKGLVGQYHQSGLDLDASQAKAKAAHWDDALKQSQIFVDQAKGPEAKQAALAKQADIAKAAAEAKVEAQKQVVRQATMDKERAAAAAASGAAAAAATQYKHQQDAMENRRKDIALGLTAEKQHFDMDKSKAAEGKTDPSIQAALNATQGTGSTALIPGVLANPFRGSAFSSDKSKDMANNGFNTAVDSVAHKIAGIKGREEQAAAMAHLHIEPHDGTDMIKAKQDLFRQIYGSLQMGGAPENDPGASDNDK